ncbi:MAG: cytochrome c3 family protein [Pyrinomonadaceae bacterium]
MRVGRRKLLAVRIFVIIAACGLVVAGAIVSRRSIVSGEAGTGGDPAATPRRARRTSPSGQKPADFAHGTAAHRMDCASCHKFPSPNWERVRSEPFPDITDHPRHQSCVGCHKAQFFRGDPPRICTVCHTDPGPRKADRHPFPNPPEIFDRSPKGKTAVSDFSVHFPHEKHLDIVSAASARSDGFVKVSLASPRWSPAEESCAVCHSTLDPQGEGSEEYLVKPPPNLGDKFWLKRGTFKSVPAGHASCFTCHSADSGLTPAPTDCATCHKLKAAFAPDFDLKLALAMTRGDKPSLDRWRERVSAGAFRHEFMSHADTSCATCHTGVATMNTADPRSRRVEIASCAVCHATATLDDGGAINFEVDARTKDPKFECTKCHVTYGKLAIPRSHFDAIKAAGGQ